MFLKVVLNLVNILEATELYIGIPHFIVTHRYCIFFFYKFKVCGNPVSIKSIGTKSIIFN